MTLPNPFRFAQQVRQEIKKVTWPTRRETLITAVAVLLMVVLFSLFFMVVDQVLGYLISLILQIRI
ncbi:MAG: preprotein translocase subunit SecE [Hyphomicrobiaceae bacterium]|nr:preprotein translocase subunit SecE [Hyphomicrobiaceae bacterium]